MDAPSLPDQPQGPAESYAPYGRESVDCKGDTTGNPLAERFGLAAASELAPQLPGSCVYIARTGRGRLDRLVF